jgi:tetratricopeptide (TPR) repeat protein
MNSKVSCPPSRGLARLGSLPLLAFFPFVLVVAAPHASAQLSNDERARTHFQSGRLYYEEGAYDRALAEFESAYRLSGRSELLVNMANANERLGHHAAAVANLRGYLQSLTDAEQRERVERRIENLERLSRAREEREAAEEEARNQAAVDARHEDEALEEEAPEPAPKREKARIGIAAPLTAYAIGVAGLVTLAVAAPLALSRDSALRDGCGSTQSCSREDVAPADRAALVADIGIGVAVAGVLSGAILHLLHLKRRGSDDAPPEAALQLAPSFARGGGFVSMEARF